MPFARLLGKDHYINNFIVNGLYLINQLLQNF